MAHIKDFTERELIGELEELGYSVATANEDVLKKINQLTSERDVAVQMLADWCDAVRDNGTGWDDWDEHYKDADFRPCLIRNLIDSVRKPSEN